MESDSSWSLQGPGWVSLSNLLLPVYSRWGGNRCRDNVGDTRSGGVTRPPQPQAVGIFCPHYGYTHGNNNTFLVPIYIPASLEFPLLSVSPSLSQSSQPLSPLSQSSQASSPPSPSHPSLSPSFLPPWQRLLSVRSQPMSQLNSDPSIISPGRPPPPPAGSMQPV
ncbi:hypothetical protein Pmani_016658 [Petrolisthes manimaculis]|uniref:Uncharacterized protein n=1 Tax=Petrolisthes manimaculis TaxID=1843537 RepID=A0AAE1PPA0_9EUCA|nr:hypothetical protein Pmani_016658 [Petrolisthes manimaculis]